MTPLRVVRKGGRLISRFADLLERYDKWVYMILLVITAFAIGLMVYTIYDSGHKYKVLALANKDRLEDIQGERVVNIYNFCLDINRRNQNAIEQVNLIYSRAYKTAKTDADRARLNASKQSTLGLINALVPFREDCLLFAAKQVPSIKK